MFDRLFFIYLGKDVYGKLTGTGWGTIIHEIHGKIEGDNIRKDQNKIRNIQESFYLVSNKFTYFNSICADNFEHVQKPLN